MINQHWNKVKYQLSIQRPSLSRKGLLDLSTDDNKKLEISSLADMGTQKFLKILNLTGTKLESLETLPAQPNLQQIIADNSQISSFVGLSRHPKLRSISFLSSPISEQDNYRLSLLVVAGQMLSIINGVPVKAKERITAAKYPIISRYLIESGWKIQVPIPTTDEFRKLAYKYKLKLKGVDSEFTNEEAQRYFSPPPQLVPIDTQKISDSEDDEETEVIAQDVDLQDMIYEKLHSIGITVQKGPNFQKELIAAVKGVANMVKNFEGCYKEVFQINDSDEFIDEEEDINAE